MTREDAELDAGEFVLGTIEPEKRKRFLQDLDADSELRRLTEDWEQRLGPLAEALDPVAPPDGLWSRIEADLDRPVPGTSIGHTVRADEGDWRAFLKGVEKKILLHDRAAGIETYLLRMSPGSRLPPHPHKVTEECLVLEGEVWIGDLRFTAGDFHVATPEDVHPEVLAPNGALLYLRGEIHAPAA